MVERVDWHMVACWGEVAEQAQGTRKGDVVQVEGPIRTRSYGEGANKKWITEIVASKVTVDAQERKPQVERCLLYTSPSPRDRTRSRMPSSA